MHDAYRDSSALVKRYVQEPGTTAVDIIFDRAPVGAITIATSVWNLGEAVGVFDYRRRRRLLTEHEFHLAAQNLTSEVLGLLQDRAI
jgi:predicted nucleic acid-binding protein